MTIQSIKNLVTWEKSSELILTGDAVEILPANPRRVGLIITLDCEVSDTCIIIKDENNNDDLGVTLFREGVGVAVFARLEYEMKIEAVHQGALYAWKHSGADATLYITEYIG
jgi:hypothetical protein